MLRQGQERGHNHGLHAQERALALGRGEFLVLHIQGVLLRGHLAEVLAQELGQRLAKNGVLGA